jgi:hypothetical protein
MNEALRLVLALGVLSLSLSCANQPAQGPLPGMKAADVTAIEVSNQSGGVIRFTKPADIRFVLQELTLTEPRAEGKVNPEFKVKVHRVSSPPVTLRLERGSVGPDVPASDVVTRWYFKTESLYAFIQAAFSRGSGSSAA